MWIIRKAWKTSLFRWKVKHKFSSSVSYYQIFLWIFLDFVKSWKRIAMDPSMTIGRSVGNIGCSRWLLSRKKQLTDCGCPCQKLTVHEGPWSSGHLGISSFANQLPQTHGFCISTHDAVVFKGLNQLANPDSLEFKQIHITRRSAWVRSRASVSNRVHYSTVNNVITGSKMNANHGKFTER